MAVLRWSNGTVDVWHGDCREVAAQEPPGSFALAIVDGPYGCGKSKVWDRMKVADLPDWYAPHLDDIDRLCAPSASLYLWNTAEGWATLHPGIVARGWTFRSLVVWDKLHAPSQLGAANMTGAVDRTEVCGLYTRGGGLASASILGGNVWTLAEQAFRSERLRESEATPDRNPRRGLTFSAKHPCQKPLAFAERMVLASTRPGDRVWAPFGGTCREALACKLLAERDPSQARECVTAEIDMDGRNYLDAVVRVLEGRGVKPEDPNQPGLFGGAQ